MIGRPLLAPPSDGPLPTLAYESRNVPEVMTPWELRDHLSFLLSEASPGDPRIPAIAHQLNRLRMSWHALWARSGDDPGVRAEYASLLTQNWTRITELGAHEVALRNQMSLGHCLNALVFSSAVSSEGGMDGDQRVAPASLKPAPPVREAPKAQGLTRPPVRDPVFDRPIFIVSTPRSGSSLLFETLAKAPTLFTIGGESHRLMESIPALTPAAQGWASNRVTPRDVPPETVALLRERFALGAKGPGWAPSRHGACANA